MMFTDVRPRGKLSHTLAIVVLYQNPILRFLDHLGVLNKGTVNTVTLRNGLRFSVRARTGDLEVIDEVFIHRVYDAALTRIRSGQTVVDVGAHCGVFTVASAARGARVV